MFNSSNKYKLTMEVETLHAACTLYLSCYITTRFLSHHFT